MAHSTQGGSFGARGAIGPHPGPYDRRELQQSIDAYLEALIRRDPSRLPLARSFRLTENGQALAIGDGLWSTASRLGRYRHYVLDPQSGQAAFVGVVQENGKAIILALRLKLAGRELTEAEAIVSREDILFYRGGTDALEALGAPSPIWTEPVPASEIGTREQMIATAEAYFSALERNDGTRTAPFAPDCRRLDNGVYATQNAQFDRPGDPPFYALGPGEQLRLGYFVFVTAIRERRCPVVDEEFGVVFSLPLLDHAGTIHEAHLTDGRTVPIGVVQPFSWQCAELFKVKRGQIAQ
ncbi:MAG: hypothetical protein ACREUG_01340, partial [Steroidobacteraceae bacterium]